MAPVTVGNTSGREAAAVAERRVLIIDDEPVVRDVVARYLALEGYEVQAAADGAEGLRLARSWQPDLLVLDLMLPGVDGLEVCRTLLAESGVPIIMLTAKAAEIDRVLGLELGADDYVTKPFSPRELTLRIKGLLRRRETRETKAEQMKFGELNVDVPAHRVTVNGKPIELTATEFKLLTLLAQRRGRVQSRDQLLKDVW